MGTPQYGQARMTPVRRTLAEAAASMEVAFTVEDLAAAAGEIDPSAGAIATAYRAVAAMEKAGYIERVGKRRGSALYAHCGTGHHHHHVICDGCGKVSSTPCPVVEAMSETPGDGFVITRHEVTLYGLCPSCASGSCD